MSVSIDKRELTTTQAAFLLGVSEGYVYKLIRRGKLDTYEAGGRRLISREAVRDYLLQRGAQES